LNNDQASSGALFAAGLAICLGAVRYRLGTFAQPDSGLVPFLAGARICLFCAIGFIQATARRSRGVGWVSPFTGVFWEKVLAVAVALVAYVLLLKPLGFLLCTALFVGYLLRAIEPQRWTIVVSVAVITALASYGMFELWLHAQLPKGFLGI
jgi:putative tricarboxylic transport membrane protein